MLSIPDIQSDNKSNIVMQNGYIPYPTKMLGSTQFPRPLIHTDENKNKWLKSLQYNSKGLKVKQLDFTTVINEDNMKTYLPQHMTQFGSNYNYETFYNTKKEPAYQIKKRKNLVEYDR